VWNTGNKVIRPGQRIIWDFPQTERTMLGKRKANISGEPLTKQLFATLPLESAFGNASSTSYDFVTALWEIHNLGGTPETDEGKSLKASMDAGDVKEFTRKALYLYEDLRSRIIGIALSGAAPGEQFDIMLCSSH